MSFTFSPELYQIVVQIATFLSILAMGLGSFVPIFNKIKDVFAKVGLPLSGWSAEIGAAIFATLFALVMGYANGQLTETSFTATEYAGTALLVLGLAKVQYEAWLRQRQLPIFNSQGDIIGSVTPNHIDSSDWSTTAEAIANAVAENSILGR